MPNVVTLLGFFKDFEDAIFDSGVAELDDEEPEE